MDAYLPSARIRSTGSLPAQYPCSSACQCMRLCLPCAVEAYLPRIDEREGIDLDLHDTRGGCDACSACCMYCLCALRTMWLPIQQLTSPCSVLPPCLCIPASAPHTAAAAPPCCPYPQAGCTPGASSFGSTLAAPTAATCLRTAAPGSWIGRRVWGGCGAGKHASVGLQDEQALHCRLMQRNAT
jgi:hypothetical protein